MPKNDKTTAASIAREQTALIEEEHAALFERICSYKDFKNSRKRLKLFRYLFDNRHRHVTNQEIFRNTSDVPESAAHPHDPAHIRQIIGEVREALEKYAHDASDKWICILDDATRGIGYRLEFKRAPAAPSELFWEPHLTAAGDVIVVCGDHLFFYDPKLNQVLRLYDLNVDGTKEEMRAALKAAYPAVFKSDLEPSHNFYLSTGEVLAYEALQKWFHQKSHVLVPRFTSREIKPERILKSAPILLGRPATNRFMRSILDSPQAAHLAYRVHTTVGAVSIKSPNRAEMNVLSQRFPITRDGILGPVPNWEVAFGIVCRLPNPGGRSAITIISYHYYAKIVTQIVEELTNDRLAKSLLDQLDLAESHLPDSFEMLFGVRLSPAGIEGEGRAELLCWRTYS